MKENHESNIPMREDRVKLNVLGISYSPLQSGAFALLLAQEDGPYRLPMVIGSAEAQSIAIKIEGVMTPRPMTHDLFCGFAHAFGVELQEVFIYKFEDGIFSSEMRFTDGSREVVLDSRTSDAIAIAVRTGSPIYTTREILVQAGTVFEKSDEPESDPNQSQTPRHERRESQRAMTDDDRPIAELEARLQKLIDDENYEQAARLSEIIKRRKGQL